MLIDITKFVIDESREKKLKQPFRQICHYRHVGTEKFFFLIIISFHIIL